MALAEKSSSGGPSLGWARIAGSLQNTTENEQELNFSIAQVDNRNEDFEPVMDPNITRASTRPV